MFFYPIVHILACKYPLEVLLFSWMRYVKGKCIPLFHGDSFSFRYIYPYIDGCLKMIVRWCFYQNWSVFIFLGLGTVEGGGYQMVPMMMQCLLLHLKQNVIYNMDLTFITCTFNVCWLSQIHLLIAWAQGIKMENKISNLLLLSFLFILLPCLMAYSD